MKKWKYSQRTYYRAGLRSVQIVGNEIEFTFYGVREGSKLTHHETHVYRVDLYYVRWLAGKLHGVINELQSRVTSMRSAMLGEQR